MKCRGVRDPRIPIPNGVYDQDHRANARDSCGLRAGARHCTSTGNFWINAALIRGKVNGDELLIDLQQVIPTPEAADYMICMAEKGAEQ